MTDRTLEKLQSELDRVVESHTHVTTGKGRGSIGATATFTLSAPLQGRNYVQAICLTDCPPGDVQLLRSTEGQWYAMSNNTAVPGRTQVSQNRRSRRQPQPQQTLETLIILSQVRYSWNAAMNRFDPEGDQRMFFKFNAAPMQYVDLPQRGAVYMCNPVRAGVYVVQAFQNEDPGTFVINQRRYAVSTFLIQNGTIAKTFTTEQLILSDQVLEVAIEYPEEWQAYSDYLCPNYALQFDNRPPIYQNSSYSADSKDFFVYAGQDSSLQAPQATSPGSDSGLLNWYSALKPLNYQFFKNGTAQPPTQLLSITEADLQAMGLALTDQLRSTFNNNPIGTPPLTIRDFVDRPNVVYSDYRLTPIRTSTRETTLRLIRGIVR